MLNRDYRITDPDLRDKYLKRLQELEGLFSENCRDCNYFLEIATICFVLDRLEQAFDAATFALCLNEGSYFGWQLLGRIYFSWKKYKEAYISFSKAADNFDADSDKERYLYLVRDTLDDIAVCQNLLSADKQEKK